MADVFSINLPRDGINIPVNIKISGEEKVRNLGDALNRIARGTDLQSYWKTQTELISHMTDAYRDFVQVSSSSNAESLVKAMNAVEGATGKNLSEVFENFSELQPVLQKATGMVGKVVGEFSKENFRDAFDAFEFIKAQGIDLTEIFSKLNSGTDVEALNQQIASLGETLARTKVELRDARSELDSLKSGEGVDNLEKQIESLEQKLSMLTTRMTDEFRAFLRTNDIAETDIWGDDRFSDYFDNIQSGYMTSKEAISQFKVEYDGLFNREGTTGAFESQAIEAFATQLSEACGMIRELNDVIKSGNVTGGGNDAASFISKLGEVVGGAELSQEKINSISQMLGKISSLRNFTIDEGQLNVLKAGLESLSKLDNLQKLSSLTNISLEGFSDVKISKAALRNLAEFLPQLQNVDVSKLEQLSRIDLKNFNDVKVSKASVENLKNLISDLGLLGGDRSQAGNVAGQIGIEADKLSEVNKKYAEHVEAVEKARAAEASKAAEANNLTSSLEKEISALNRARDAAIDYHEAIERLGQMIRDPDAGIGGAGTEDRVPDGTGRIREVNRRIKQLEDLQRKYRSLMEQWSNADTVVDGVNHFTDLSSGYDRIGDLLTQLYNNSDETPANLGAIHTAITEIEMAAANAANEIDRLNLDTRNMNPTEVSKAAEQMEKMRASITANMEKWGAASNTDQFRTYASQLEELDALMQRVNSGMTYADYAENFNRIKLAATQAADAIKSMHLDFNQTDVNKAIKSVQTTIDSFTALRDTARSNAKGDSAVSGEIQSLTNNISELTALQTALKNGTITLDQYKQRVAEIGAAASETVSRLRQFNKAANDKVSNKARQDEIRSIETYINKIDVMMSKLSSSSGLYKSLDSLKSRFRAVQDAFKNESINPEQFEKARESVSRLRIELEQLSGRSRLFNFSNIQLFGGGLDMLYSRINYYLSLSQIIMQGVKTVKQMVQTTIELDSALTQLQIVTNASDSAMKQYGITAAQTAQQIGGTTKDLIDSATVFARLGYTLDESGVLSKYTNMLQNVGDIDASTAQNAITAIVKAFDVNIDQVGEVMDKMVVVGNNFPISVSQIAEGMNNAGSMLATAGNTLEESIALLTASNVTVQNISKASTGLRTIAARIRKTVSEEDGDEVINEAKYEEMVQALTKYQVSLTDINGEYRSTYAIIRDIAAVWSDMTSMEKAAVTEALAGTRQQNIFASLMTQFGDAEGAMDAMANSAGALNTAYSTYADSVQGHLNSLKAAFDELAQTVINSTLVKVIVDAGRIVLQIITSIVGVIHKLTKDIPTTIATISTAIVAAMAAIEVSLGGLAVMFGEAIPIWPIIIAVAALGTAIVSTTVKSTKSLEQLRSELSDVKSEIEKLNGQWQANKEKIQELKESGISGYYEDEISYLEQENKLLEAQIALLSEKGQHLREQAAQASNEAVASWLRSDYSTDDFGNAILLNTTGSGALRNAISEYQSAKESLDNALESGDKLAIEYANKAVDTTKSHLEDLTQSAIDFADSLAPNTVGRTEIIRYITLANEALGAFDELHRKQRALFDAVFDGKNPELLVDKILELSEDELDQYIDAVKNGAKSLDEIKKAIAENQTSLPKSIRDLTSLKDELVSATAALEEYNNAISGEHGEIASQYESAYNKFLEDWNAGKTGTKAVQAAVELILSDDAQRAFGYDLQEMGNYLSSDLFKAIFTGDDGDVGLRFANYIRENLDTFDDYVKITPDDLMGGFDFAYTSIEDLAYVTGMTEDAVTSLLDALDAYGVQVMTSAKDTEELVDQLGLSKASIASTAPEIRDIAKQLAESGNKAPEILQILKSLESAKYIDLSGVGGQLTQIISDAGEFYKEPEADKDITITTNADVIQSDLERLEEFAFTDKRLTIYEKYIKGIEDTESTGTTNAPGGPTLVNEKGPEIISENGSAYIAGGGEPTVVDLNRGAVVLNAEDTRKALKGGTVGKTAIRAAAGGQGKYTVYTDAVVEAAMRAAKSLPTAASIPSGSGEGAGGSGSGSGGSSSSGWFEEQYKEHQHLLKMDQESVSDYLAWLDDAYKRAYDEGEIDLDGYRKYEEEVYKQRQDNFKDYLSDTEHLIELEKNGDNNPTVIINFYKEAMDAVEKELEKCYADGLDSTNDYVQYLQNIWIKYNDAITDANEDATKEAKDQVKDLVEYRIKMIKQELKNEQDALKTRIDNLKDFYDKQKDMLQKAYDDEETEDERAEKRKTIADLEAELKQLEYDNSAWAEKRKNELRQQLAESQKDLDKFEKQQALEMAKEMLDQSSEAQVNELQKKIDELEAKLNNPKWLYETALADVQNNSIELYEQMIAYNDAYGLTNWLTCRVIYTINNHTYMRGLPKAVHQNMPMRNAGMERCESRKNARMIYGENLSIRMKREIRRESLMRTAPNDQIVVIVRRKYMAAEKCGTHIM